MFIYFIMYVATFVLLNFIFSANGFLLTPDSIVRRKTPVGEIIGQRGRMDVDGRSKDMVLFCGIPYAEKPVRFAKPVPKAPFAAPFTATTFGPICPQPYVKLDDVSEDCLSLNIYVPTTSITAGDKPVMVWIHGGGFFLGAGSQQAFEHLSAFGDVIVVTLNYRLAQLGFLSINSSYIPGNYGLWDQHLAIQWVHDNIGAFGGNASEVTIFGVSAGSSSVMYQTLYPGNKGYFRRAIAESGSITSDWAKTNKNNANKNARDFANKCGCPSANDVLMMQCLLKVPIAKIARAMNASMYSLVDNPWTVTVDNQFVVTDQSNMFIPSDVTAEALAFYNEIELIIGLNRDDGLVNLPETTYALHQTNPEHFTLTKDQFDNFIVPWMLRTHNDFANVSDIAKRVVSFTYTNWTQPNDEREILRNYVKFTTDICLTVPILTALNARMPNGSKSYLYEFAFRPTKQSDLHHPTRIDNDASANHGDELQYVLGILGGNHTHTEEQLSHAIMTMWTNFAKTGDPNQPEDVRHYYPVTWPSYDSQAQSYLEFNNQMSPQSVKQRLAADRMNMWFHLLPELLRRQQCAG